MNMVQVPKCKITILKTTLNKDLIDDYIIDEYKEMEPCEKFKEGDEFIIDPMLPTVPENFCSWAWADIRNYIIMISSGANCAWLKQTGITIAACSDWFRPVYFKIQNGERY